MIQPLQSFAEALIDKEEGNAAMWRCLFLFPFTL
jgi:hypothetical protein